MADWLSRQNHAEKKDEENPGLNSSVHAVKTSVDIPIYMSIEDIQEATLQEKQLQDSSTYILTGWPYTKTEIREDVKFYWLYKDDMAVIDGLVMKERTIIPIVYRKTPCLNFI